jgi:hypothetical protein
MGPGYEKMGLLMHDSCDEKRAEKIFILYKRVYYVLQVAFVVSIYKIRYTRGIRYNGQGSTAARARYPR